MVGPEVVLSVAALARGSVAPILSVSSNGFMVGSGCLRALFDKNKDKALGCHAERRTPVVNKSSSIFLTRMMIATHRRNMENDRACLVHVRETCSRRP